MSRTSKTYAALMAEAEKRRGNDLPPTGDYVPPERPLRYQPRQDVLTGCVGVNRGAGK